MRVNQNIAAQNAYRNLSASNASMGKTLEKLSSGNRINRAADDAAGLVISQGLRAQVGGLRQASRNAQDGISVAQTAEGALSEVHNMLGRMRDLAVQANSGSNDDAAKTAAQAEIVQLRTEITDISAQTKFGSTLLLDGSYNGEFQVGANVGESIAMVITDSDATALGVNAIDVSTDADAAITAIDAAITLVSENRGNLGAVQNRFESRISNLNVATENLSASESRIRDTDYAQEMVTFTRGQIMNQVGTSMLGQANQLPQGVLSLLRG